MAVPVNAVVDEAIRYEHSLAAIYHAFSTVFSEDADFWWDLSVSEKKHASLLEASRKLFDDEFSRETVPADLDALRASNDSLESLLDGFEADRPPREEAFRIALGLEDDDNELTLHRLLDISPADPAREVVDHIRNENSTHTQMILDYASGCGLSL